MIDGPSLASFMVREFMKMMLVAVVFGAVGSAVIFAVALWIL